MSHAWSFPRGPPLCLWFSSHGSDKVSLEQTDRQLLDLLQKIWTFLQCQEVESHDLLQKYSHVQFDLASFSWWSFVRVYKHRYLSRHDYRQWKRIHIFHAIMTWSNSIAHQTWFWPQLRSPVRRQTAYRHKLHTDTYACAIKIYPSRQMQNCNTTVNDASKLSVILLATSQLPISLAEQEESFTLFYHTIPTLLFPV